MSQRGVCLVGLSFKHKQTMNILPFPKQALVFNCLQYKSFDNTLGKREIARNKVVLVLQEVICCNLNKIIFLNRLFYGEA